MKTILLTIMLGSTLSLAITPTPTPAVCPNDYRPICAENEFGNEVIFANLCKFENVSDDVNLDRKFTFKHRGVCGSSPTPTPNPLPSELTCDSTLVTTTADDVKINNPSGVYSIEARASTNLRSVAVNMLSLKFVNAEKVYVDSLEIPNEGTWYSRSGNVSFLPLQDFNGTSTVTYVVNNDCDYASGISNEATITVRAEGGIPFPVVNERCIFSSIFVDAIDDNVTLKKGEKLKTISVLSNDANFNSATDVVFSSLRLIDKDEQPQRRIYVKGKGTWLADTTSAEVLFLPDANFHGETSVNYVIHSTCSYPMEKYPKESQAKITVVGPTPTPTPVPTPTSTPTPVPTPISIPTPVVTPKPIHSPTPTPGNTPSAEIISSKEPTNNATRPVMEVATEVVQSDNASTFGISSLLGSMIISVIVGLRAIRKEEV